MAFWKMLAFQPCLGGSGCPVLSKAPLCTPQREPPQPVWEMRASAWGKAQIPLQPEAEHLGQCTPEYPALGSLVQPQWDLHSLQGPSEENVGEDEQRLNRQQRFWTRPRREQLKGKCSSTQLKPRCTLLLSQGGREGKPGRSPTHAWTPLLLTPLGHSAAHTSHALKHIPLTLPSPSRLLHL